MNKKPITARAAPVKPKRKPGRPTNRTDATKERVLEAARKGYANLDSIARAAGIGPSTLRDWRANDPEFDAAIEQAREGAIDVIEGTVLDKAKDDARIALAVLKARRRDTYGDRPKVELTGADGGPLTTVALDKVASLSDADLAAAIARLEAALGGSASGS